MKFSNIKQQYITYPLLAVAVVLLMSVLAIFVLFIELIIGQTLMRFFGAQDGNAVMIFVSPIVFALIVPLFPIIDADLMLWCHKVIYAPRICSLSSPLLLLWQASIFFGTILFYLVLGYLIAVCKETVFVVLRKDERFSFRISDPWRIVRIVWILLVVAAATIGLWALQYLPDDFYGMLRP